MSTASCQRCRIFFSILLSKAEAALQDSMPDSVCRKTLRRDSHSPSQQGLQLFRPSCRIFFRTAEILVCLVYVDGVRLKKCIRWWERVSSWRFENSKAWNYCHKIWKQYQQSSVLLPMNFVSMRLSGSCMSSPTLANDRLALVSLFQQSDRKPAEFFGHV